MSIIADKTTLRTINMVPSLRFLIRLNTSDTFTKSSPCYNIIYLYCLFKEMVLHTYTITYYYFSFRDPHPHFSTGLPTQSCTSNMFSSGLLTPLLKINLFDRIVFMDVLSRVLVYSISVSFGICRSVLAL